MQISDSSNRIRATITKKNGNNIFELLGEYQKKKQVIIQRSDSFTFKQIEKREKEKQRKNEKKKYSQLNLQ